MSWLDNDSYNSINFGIVSLSVLEDIFVKKIVIPELEEDGIYNPTSDDVIHKVFKLAMSKKK